MAAQIPFVNLIRDKKDKKPLTDEQIKAMVRMIVSGEAQDAQIGAMLMAIFLNGMTNEETASLTKYMVDTGTKMDWTADHPEWQHELVDKHSTGGVGDKVSLVLAPALAACGLKVPMMSGRGLEHTGGTLDKLESIPGFRVELTREEMLSALEEVGCFIAGTTKGIAPCDRELYKRRDVTATVDNISLVVSSIVSKKVAEGTRSLIMDIKVGRAAFYKTVETATELAEAIIDVASLLGVPTSAALTRMDVPIGRAVGNALEVAEVIECMKGRGPEDLKTLVVALSAELLARARPNEYKTADLAKRKIESTLAKGGGALEKFEKMLTKQGVAPGTARDLCKDPWSVLQTAPHITVEATADGVVSDIDAMEIAKACHKLGAGRNVAGQAIDHSVGVRLERGIRVGAKVTKGTGLLKVFHSKKGIPADVLSQLKNSVTIAPTGTICNPQEDLIIKIIKK